MTAVIRPALRGDVFPAEQGGWEVWIDTPDGAAVHHSPTPGACVDWAFGWANGRGVHVVLSVHL